MITAIADPLATTGPELVRAFDREGVATVLVLRLRGPGGPLVECVDGLDPPLPRSAKWIANVSTQAGCPVGCPYCDAGGGYEGDLTADEILAQVQAVLARHPGRAAGCAKLKVHLSRMGEPALNDAVLEALERLPAGVCSPGLWACLATVAPRGREEWFARLHDVKERRYRGRFQLQFSLNSTDGAARRRLVPFPHWDLAAIARYGAAFHGPGDRKVVLNFALAEGVPFDAGVLVERFDPDRFAVKLTPINPTVHGAAAGLRTLLRSERARALDAAIAALGEAGFDVIVSVGDPREDEVGSNCGQAVRYLVG